MIEPTRGLVGLAEGICAIIIGPIVVSYNKKVIEEFSQMTDEEYAIYQEAVKKHLDEKEQYKENIKSVRRGIKILRLFGIFI